MANIKRKGLGKGLGALIPEKSVFIGGRTILNVDIEKIIPNPRQPRQFFSTEALEELADSIKEHGVAQPILVRQRGNAFELVAGERRWRAAQKAGLKSIPVIIKDFSDQQALEITLVENLQREDLNPLEESEAYQMLHKEFTLSQAEIAKKVGKSRSAVANSMRLLELDDEIKQALRGGEISAGHARAILSAGSKEDQMKLFKEIIDNQLNVRQVETRAQKTSKHKKKKKIKAESRELSDIRELLIEKLGTKVKMYGSAARGKIEIEYFSQEDLERIIETITGDVVI